MVGNEEIVGCKWKGVGDACLKSRVRYASLSVTRGMAYTECKGLKPV